MTYDMPDQQVMLDRAADAVRRARAAGADAAEARCRESRAMSVHMRLGALEEVSQSEDSDLSLRLFVGQRSATLSTADLRDDAIDTMVDRAMAMARIAPENPWSGLAPEDMLASGPLPDLDTFDTATLPDADMLRDRAERTEAAARSVAGVTNSDGGSASYAQAVHAHVTSHGFAHAGCGTSFGHSASVIAGHGDHMQRDYDHHAARHFADLEPADVVGQRAGERAASRLDPVTMTGGAMPVLFDPRVAGSLIRHLVSAMAGPAIAKKRSFLVGHADAQLFPAAISIADDPHRPRGMRSFVVDAEGLLTRPSRLVDAGRIGGWLCDAASARQLGLRPTGHAAGGGGVTTGNLSVSAGPDSVDAMMADIRHGVLVTELIGQGVDLLTGDYSRGASGRLIIDGALAGPVTGITIAGNLRTMFADLRAANDVCRRFSTHVPTLRTDSMTVAGG